MKHAIIALVLIATTVATACRKNEMQTEEQKNLHLLTSTRDFDTHQPQQPNPKVAQAAAKTAAFAQNQKLGLFLHTANPITTAEACHSRNIEYATTDAGATWNQRAALDDEIDPAATYYATAYTPFVQGAFPPSAMPINIETDQSTPEAIDRSDLRIAQNAPLTGSGSAIQTTLDFTHALAMFELKLLIPLMVEGRQVDQIEAITFENLATQGSINLGTGVVTTDLHSVASVTPRIVSGSGAIGVLTTYQAIVVPQNVDGGVLLAKIRCQMNDGSTETMDYITPSKGWISFRAGVKTSITLLPTAEAAFVGELPELLDGQAHTGLVLPIFVETGLRWTVDAPGCDWLTLSNAPEGTYGKKLSSTSATGAWTNIYVKVSANTAQTMPRTGDLTLRAWRTDGSEVTPAVLRLVQNHYTFAPVGGVWNTSFAAASDPVQPFVSNQQWTAESDAAWLLLATSPTVGSGNPVQKFVKAGALAANELYMQVTQNASPTARRGVVTISSPVAGTDTLRIYVNQMGNQPYVEVGNLRWATGNLVATRSSTDGVSAPGCMIGAPDDGGLYFQFGSLIGYKGGALANGGTGVAIPPYTTNGDKWWNGAAAWSWNNDAMVWPTEQLSTPTSWPYHNAAGIDALTDYYFNYSSAPWETAEKNIRDFDVLPGTGTGTLGTGRYAALGVGDPCSYYLGDPWRLPTSPEIVAMCNNQAPGYDVNVAWSACNASWTGSPVAGGNFAGNQLFFPASGYRNGSNGSFYSVTTYGSYWSSSVYNAPSGLNLGSSSSWVCPQDIHNRSLGFPVRCVQDVPTRPNPPTADDYVTINGLKWAKGNLIANGKRNCKVGKPEDGGLYFQFGSLIGYKGGAQANGGTGVGIPSQADGSYWNGASSYSWANEAMVYPAELVGTKTTWTNNTGANIATLNDYYFNYSVAPWNALEKDIRTFAESITGDKGTGTLATGRYVKQGIGDPCSYYLGDPWRLPTSPEIKAMCNNQGSYDATIAWSACNASWTDSPVAGGNFAGNQLFFPVSGGRLHPTGSFYTVVAGGLYWSSSVYSATHGPNLTFDRGGVSPQSSNSRSSGFPVRCVSDAP